MTLANRSKYWIATMCAFTITAAACGSDSEDVSTSSAEPTSTTESAEDGTTEPSGDASSDDEGSVEQVVEADGTPIKLGLIYVGTGLAASAYADTDDAALAWTAYWNAHGGVEGHPVEVVAIDMEGDAAVAAAAARELVEVEGVVGIIVQDTTSDTAISSYLAEKGIPVIGGSSNGFDPVAAPNTQFAIASTAPGSYALSLASAQAAGFNHFTGIVCSEFPTCGSADEFYEANSPAFDLDYTNLVTASHGEPSYTSFCLAVTGDGEDLINLAFAPALIVPIAQECVAQGFEGSFSLPANTIEAAILDEAGDVDVVGYLNGFPWWADSPAVATYRDAMAATAPDAEYRSPAATNTWATLELFRTALSASLASGDEVTVADVLAAYYALDGETLDGLLPLPVTFTEGEGPQPGVPCGWLIKYSDGAFSTVSLGDTANGAEGDLQSYCYAG